CCRQPAATSPSFSWLHRRTWSRSPSSTRSSRRSLRCSSAGRTEDQGPRTKDQEKSKLSQVVQPVGELAASPRFSLDISRMGVDVFFRKESTPAAERVMPPAPSRAHGGTPAEPLATEQVLAHLRRLIESGQLRPGQRLPPERGLAKQLGVSRSSLRA